MDKKLNDILVFVVSLVFPFGVLIFLRKKIISYPKIISLISAFYGYNFIIYSEELDSWHYKQDFFYWSTKSFNDIYMLLKNMYSLDSQVTDPLKDLLIFLVTRVTSDYRFVFAFFAYFITYFTIKNIKIVISELSFISNIQKLLIVGFIIIIPVFEINVPRMWIAAQIFIYGSLLIFKNNKLNGIVMITISLLTHFSFLYPLLILIFSLFAKFRNKTLIIGLILSCFISFGFIQDFILSFVSIFDGGVLTQKILGYTDTARVLDVLLEKDNTSWFHVYKFNVLNYLIIVLLFFLNKEIIFKDFKYFYYSILILIISNFLSEIPDMWRFIQFGFASFFLSSIPLFKGFKNRLILNYYVLASVSFWGIIAVRDGYQTIDLQFFYTNWLIRLI